MGPRGGTNSKVQAALEKKRANQAIKDAKAAQKSEELEATQWEKGANTRKKNRMAAEANKADEAQRKRREKEELRRAEEEAMGSGGKVKTVTGMKKKQQKKKKGGNDFSLLEESLVSAAEKKSKAAKRSERLKKEAEERKNRELALKKSQDQAKVDPLLANTNAMIGVTNNESLDDVGSGRQANILRGQANEASGIEGAIKALSVNGKGEEDQHPEKRMKAQHKAFEERMMPQMKEDYPGLKMSQYKDKIFQLWKKSPENPMNQRTVA